MQPIITAMASEGASGEGGTAVSGVSPLAVPEHTYDVPGKPHVIVVGSGVAGLACARVLQNVYGIRVTVLEANDYVGGRVKQDTTWVPGMELELGAEFVHGTTTTINTLANAKKWMLRELFTWAQGDGGPSEERAPDGGAGYYWFDGRLYRFDNLPKRLHHMHEVLKGLEDASVEEARRDDRSLEEYLRDNGVPQEKPLLSMASAGYANTAAESQLSSIGAGRASVWDMVYDNDGEGDYRMWPSFRPLVEHLASGIRVLKNWRVAHISTATGSKDGGDASAAAGAKSDAVTCYSADGRSLSAAAIVVTASVGVLRDGLIRFTPPLAPTKQHAIKRIRFHNALKIHMRFKERFWPADCHGCVCADSFVPEMWFNRAQTGIGAWVRPADADGPAPTASEVGGGPLTTVHYAGDAAGATKGATAGAGPGRRRDAATEGEWIVTGFATSANADRVMECGPQLTIAKFLSQLARVFSGSSRSAGNASPYELFIEGRVHDWASNPYVRGGYTCPHIDEPEWAREELRRPHDGIVFFAGEACAGMVKPGATPDEVFKQPSPMTLHGAMDDGALCAPRVAAALDAAPLGPRSRL